MNYDSHLQDQLIIACLDDFTPNAAMPNYAGGQFGQNQSSWEMRVLEVVDYLLMAGLIIPNFGYQGYTEKTREEIMEILIQGDKVRGFKKSHVWDLIYFTGTEELCRRIHDAGLQNWESLGQPVNVILGDWFQSLED